MVNFHQNHISNSKSIFELEETIQKLKSILNEKESFIKNLEDESNQLRYEKSDLKAKLVELNEAYFLLEVNYLLRLLTLT